MCSMRTTRSSSAPRSPSTAWCRTRPSSSFPMSRSNSRFPPCFAHRPSGRRPWRRCAPPAVRCSAGWGRPPSRRGALPLKRAPLKVRERCRASRPRAGGASAPDGAQPRVMSASDTLRRVTRMASLLDRYIRERGGAMAGVCRRLRAREHGRCSPVVARPPLSRLRTGATARSSAVRRIAAAGCATSTTASTTRFGRGSLRAAISSRRAACRSARPIPRDNALVDALLRTERGARRGE